MAARPASRSDCCILIVDDAPGVRNSLAAILSARGFTTQTAANGAEALDQVRERPPAVVLSDIDMPIMSGLELAHELRRLQIDVPVVIMTGGGDAAERAAEVGAAAASTKPINLTWLVHTLDELCSVENAA